MTPSPARLRTVAVILAGGTGSRVGLDIPKQLLKIAGKTILEHTLDAFESHPDIDEILVMMAAGHIEEAMASGIPAVWLQEGVTDDEACRRARGRGLFVVQDRCLLKTHRRLRRAFSA